MEEVGKLTQKRVNLILGIQNQQETAWGQIDAVLKTQDDAKMLEVRKFLMVFCCFISKLLTVGVRMFLYKCG